MEAAAASSSSSSSVPVLAHPATPLPPFLTKCYQMVDDPSTDPTVSWSATGNSLVVWDPHIFSRDLLPQYFKHNNLSSFVRQLNTYGFHKMDPNRWEFANKDFLRGHKHSLKTIRKRTTQISAQTESSQGKSAPKACVEVGKFWSAEEMERLKRDKNALMQELMILRQDQQSSDSQLCSLTVRLKVMEEHQQEMLSFLAMVVQSPGFLVQLLQQNKNNRCRTKTNKKRRHPALKHGLDVAEEASFDGQIVRYQPPVTESSKSLLEPIWNAGVTTGWDPLADGITDLHINVDGLPFELTSTLETKEEILSDMPEEEWAQLIASLTSENNRETDPYNMDISAFGMDFQLPECGIQVIEQMDVEQLASQVDYLRWT